MAEVESAKQLINQVKTIAVETGEHTIFAQAVLVGSKLEEFDERIKATDRVFHSVKKQKSYSWEELFIVLNPKGGSVDKAVEDVKALAGEFASLQG